MINKLRSIFGNTEEEESDASYPYKFLVVKWRDNAHRKAARSWRSKKLVYIEGGTVQWERAYFPGRGKTISRTKGIPFYDETGGQSAPELETYAKEEPGVLNSR